MTGLKRIYIMEAIDAQIAAVTLEIESIASKRRELTADLDAAMIKCEKRKSELKVEKEKLFYSSYPTLYVIHGHARVIIHSSCYQDFQQIVACFTTEDAATAALGDKKNVRTSHHSITYRVKVEATVNIPKDILEKLNKPRYRGLEWSP